VLRGGRRDDAIALASAIAGGGVVAIVLASAIAGGAVVAIVLLPDFSPWTGAAAHFHHHHHG